MSYYCTYIENARVANSLEYVGQIIHFQYYVWMYKVLGENDRIRTKYIQCKCKCRVVASHNVAGVARPLNCAGFDIHFNVMCTGTKTFCDKRQDVDKIWTI